jgi:gliding motility-associated-like protein
MKNLLYLILIFPFAAISQTNCILNVTYDQSNLVSGTSEFKCVGDFVFDFEVDVFPADTPYTVLLTKNGSIFENGVYSPINSQSPNIFVFDSLLYAGVYELQLITSNNDTCYENFTFTDPDSVDYSINVTSPISCDTSALISVTDLTGISYPYEVGVMGSQGFDPIYFQNLSVDSFNLEDLSSGFYSFTISDINGCLTSFGEEIPIEISQGILPMQLSLNISDEISMCVNGGLAPYQFVLNSDTIISNDSCVNYLLCAGNYEVEVIDSYNNGQCAESITFDIEPIDGYIDQLSKEAIVTSGGIAPFSYSWSLNGVLVDGENDSIFNSSFCPGFYECRVVDNLGCTRVLDLNIDNIKLNITDNIDCQDLEFNIVEISPEGGTPPYLVVWNNDQTTFSISNLSPQTYLASVTDYHNCLKEDQIEIPVITDSCLYNAFSPNGDLVNDVWSINSAFLFENTEVSIYNRWGKKMFYSLGYKNGWDGKNKSNNDLPEGVYFYVISLKNGFDNLKGSISLFR